jgi:hypothetical protein
MAIALVTGLIGLLGTIIGSRLATLAAERSESRADRRAHEVALRAELQSSIAAFAAAVVAYLAAELDRWVPKPDELEPADVRQRALKHYEARSVAEAARYRLELATADEDLIARVAEIFELLKTVRSVAGSDSVMMTIRGIHAAVADVVDRGRRLLGVVADDSEMRHSVP